MNSGDGTVSHVDPETNAAVGTITVESRPISGGDTAVGGGFVWARVSTSLVVKIDPRPIRPWRRTARRTEAAASPQTTTRCGSAPTT